MSYGSKTIEIQFMKIGEKGESLRNEVIAHEKEKLIDRRADVFLYKNEIPSHTNSWVEVEKVGIGQWLIDGEMYNGCCSEECHNNVFLGIY